MKMIIYRLKSFQFSRSTVGGSRLYLSACASAEASPGHEDELRFESRFESGNLAKAIRITSAYYELHLRTDLYTNRHMQWFYFRVTNTKKQMMYRYCVLHGLSSLYCFLKILYPRKIF